ncbi:MAG: antibiotic biosynthesis monooxygenase [Chloroflexota bacterium]
MIVVMVRIPVGSAEEGARLEERFRNRMGAVDTMPGFLGFELLKGDNEYISSTRWATQADLDRWTSSQAHAQAHSRPQAPTSGGHPHADAQATSSHAEGHVPPSSTLVYDVVIENGER